MGTQDQLRDALATLKRAEASLITINEQTSSIGERLFMLKGPVRQDPTVVLAQVVLQEIEHFAESIYQEIAEVIDSLEEPSTDTDETYKEIAGIVGGEVTA